MDTVETEEDIAAQMAGCIYAFLPEALDIARELIPSIGFDRTALNIYTRNSNFDEVTSSVVITTLLMALAQTDIRIEDIAKRFSERDS